MSATTFMLLGHPRIELNGQPVLSPAQARVFALGAYLAMEGDRPSPRGTVAGVLWPDQPEERARHSLRQALSTLRHLLEPAGAAPLLDIRREAIALPSGAAWVDARHVLDLLGACAEHPHADITTCLACLARIESACGSYRGPFLDGFSLPDADVFDDWVAAWRLRLQEGVTGALETLAAAALRRGDHDQAAQTAHRLLEIDPFRETAHRHLMRAQALAGNRGAALRQYDTLVLMLDDDLGVPPEPETAALHAAIRKGTDALGESARRVADHSRIPAPTTRLVGRERELAEIADLLGHRDCRLLTLHGPGGSGKTRLAQELAATHAGTTNEVVAFIPLGDATTADDVTTSIASGLGLSPRGPGPPASHLLGWLRDRPVFLVLDNAEHLAQDLGFLDTMLASAPDLKFLVTSRERLGLPGEWMYHLPGLAWPRSLNEDSPEGYGAVALLSERIRQMRGGEDMPHAEWPAMVRICQLVEGMPLALEMAASWATTLAPAQIADGIRESLDFLEASSSSRDNSRHRSMRAVIHSSWARLEPETQVTFRRISVFDDGFTLEAATQVTDASPASLAALVNASLLTRASSGQYAMHGLLAQFATEKLEAHEAEWHDVHAHHARYYLTLIAGQERELTGRDQPAALRAIEQSLANILAAWDWSIGHGDVASLLEAAPTLWLYYVLRGRMHAGARAFEHLLAAVRQRELPDVAGLEMLGAIAYCHAGGFVSGLGHYDEAIALLTTALERLRTLVAGRSIGLTLNMLAAAELLKGDSGRARKHLEESLREAERVHDTWSTAFAVNDLGMLLHLQFSEVDAVAYCERGRQLFRQAGDVRGEALAAHNLGVIAAHSGDRHRALTLHGEAMALHEAIGDLWGVATSLVQLGINSGATGDRAAAGRYLRRALRLARENSVVPIVLEALVELAAIDPDPASAQTTLLAIMRHPSAQDAVRTRCEALLIASGATPVPAPDTGSEDMWATRMVDELSRSLVTG